MKFAIGSSIWPGISKLVEECGEVQQVCGKLLGTDGQVEHWDGTNLKDRLEDEIADLRAAIAFVSVHCNLNESRMQDRVAMKVNMFDKWHRKETTKDLK